MLGWALGAQANPLKMTTRDRLAILYSPQFNFTREGEPLIHAGIASGVESMELESESDLRVLSLNQEVAELVIPAKRRLKVTVDKGKAGVYRHWVVVDRVPWGQATEQRAAVEAWVSRGYLPRTFEVGSLFAIGSRRFDSRVSLIAVGGFDDRAEAVDLADRLEARFGIETERHSEVLTLPSGTLQVAGPGARATREDVLWLAPADPAGTFTLQTPRGERRYAGSAVFTLDADGRLSVVNAVPTETFLKGVVPSEVYASAPSESLKAQAVAARNEVLSAVGVRHLGDPYLLCSDVHCQMYEGLSRSTPRTDAAVEDTRGVLMLSASSGEQLRIVDARYSASCGGHSEHNEHVWGGHAEPWLRGHADTAAPLPASFVGGITDANVQSWLDKPPKAWCDTDRYGGNKTFRWTRSVEAATLQEWLDRNHRLGRVTDVQILARGVSGRVIRLRIAAEYGELILDRELAIRRAFGGLRSSLFVMDLQRDAKGRPTRYNFQGGGFGHGVGMCQTGAMMMAHGGHTYREILEHYYSNIRLEKLY